MAPAFAMAILLSSLSARFSSARAAASLTPSVPSPRSIATRGAMVPAPPMAPARAMATSLSSLNAMASSAMWSAALVCMCASSSVRRGLAAHIAKWYGHSTVILSHFWWCKTSSLCNMDMLQPSHCPGKSPMNVSANKLRIGFGPYGSLHEGQLRDRLPWSLSM